MCGINGVYAYRATAAIVDREELVRTRDRMRSRGPDGCGDWLSEDRCVGLAHRRLAIIDLSDAGAQPMSTPDGRLHVTFNGEIYNYRELRDELAAQGAEFRSHTDTEVLLHLYRRDGAGLVHRLRGMFAFAIWDALERRLFLARDPHGIKPLYYADADGTFRFASQVQALLAGGRVARCAAPAGLAGFFLWGSVPEPTTFYEGILALPAGHTLVVDERGPAEPQPYWRIGEAVARSAQRAVEVPPGRELESLRDALLDSVRAHLVADVPVGAFLSAGLDSSTLVGLAKECGSEIQTFTVTVDEFRGKAADEAPLAGEIARHLGVPHSVVSVSLSQAQSRIPAFLEAMDQPTIDGINTWFVTEATRGSGLKVALSGLGGDELLGGYRSFQAIPALRRRLAWADRATRLACAYRVALATLSRLSRGVPASAGERLAAAGDWRAAYRWQRGLFMPWELPYLMRPEAAAAGLRRLAELESWEPIPESLNDFAKVSVLESSRYMRNQLLRDSDWVGMAHSLELRTPLVDQRLTDTVAGLAASGRLGADKGALARCLVRGLPEAALARPKTGFTLPIWNWLNRVEALSAWKRVRWLRRGATRDYARWGYAVVARLPEAQELLA